MLAVLSMIWKVIKKPLAFAIPLPVWVILLIGVWVHFDKSSAIRYAIAEYVAAAQLEAKESIIRTKELQLELQEDANKRQAERIRSIEIANINFKTQLSNISTNNKTLKEQLNEIVKNNTCDGVSDEFLKLLQSNQ